jgi:stearoyl-CoA desaturase (Delta-9 desaturase)
MPGYAVLSEPWWIALVYVLAMGHVTNICVTLFLHRSATHGGVRFHPVVEHMMRFWLWLTTAMKTKEWVAVHRKHHAFSDREGDPHSPAVEGFWHIVLGGVFFYHEAIQDEELLEKYGKGCPDDWIERNVYSRHGTAGILLMLLVDIFLFGPLLGLLVWSGMAIWMPILGNVINGIGHALGYRNFTTKDESRNIYPLGFWIVGEELHNNHHADPKSAKFQAHWWEFDIGWIYIRFLSLLRLAEVIYARGISAKEFAARYYGDNVAEPLDHAKTRLDRMTADARSALDQAKAKVEQAGEEGAEAGA